jgi:subtilase family serine protease
MRGAENRITQRVDASRRFVVRGHLHPDTGAANDLGAADPGTALDYVTLMLKPAAGLEAFLAEQQNPSSRNYHRWLTPEQFGDRFGLSNADLDQVVQWLQSEGLQVHDVARGRHWITFSGTAARIGRALRTEFHRYRVNGETHVANAWEPSAPAAFQEVVAGFRGLNDFKAESDYSRARAPRAMPDFNSGSSHYLAPDDFATIYNVKPLYSSGIDGTGQKIAVIGQSRIDLADVQAFRRRFGLPANDPQTVLFGRDPGIIANDLAEADLDVEWAGAVARNATIVYVYSTRLL